MGLWPAIGLVLLALAPAPAPAGPRVVLRQAEGDKTLAPRFYQAHENGSPVATAYFPAENDTFELLRVRVIDERKGSPARREPSGPALRYDPGIRSEVFRDRYGWLFVPERPVVVYDYGEVPSALRGALSVAVRAVVVAELTGKPYDKTRVKKKEEYVKLPAPTLRILKRMRRHRVLATEEEYQIQAELDGPPVIEITHMSHLKQHDRPERGVLMVVVDARFPVRGRVRYKVPSVLNVSTGYRTTMALHVVAEVRAERDGKDVRLEVPEVLRVDVRLENLELSNDVLDAARRPIRHFVNEEARRKHDRIRRQANKTISKAVEDQTFRSPLLRYLLPR